MLYFKTNIPLWERVIRIAAGLALVGLMVMLGLTTWMRWAGVASGVMFACTGFIGYCPMCAVAGRRPVGGSP